MNKQIDIQSLVRPNIRKLAPYASARHEFTGTAEVFLDANENPYDTNYNRYPDPLQQDVKKLIGKLKGVNTEQIFLGNGSDEAIDLLIRIFCEPGVDEIMILPPTYGMYQVSAAVSNIAIKTVRLTAEFQPNVEEILAKANDNTKLLFLCSPNNPTGNSFEAKRMETLVQYFNGIVVIDEAYIDFAQQESSIKWLGNYPNLVILQTFSKAWGLAGIRLGMAFSNSNIIDLMNKVKPPYNINQLTQNVAIKALENVGQTQQFIEMILKERYWLSLALEDLTIVENIYPSDANFILVQFKEARIIYDYLAAKGVIVRDRSNVVLCDNCLRITVGTHKENGILVNHLRRFNK